MNEIENAKFVDGDDCSVCRSNIYEDVKAPHRDYLLRVVLCGTCCIKLLRRKEDIATLHTQLHRKTFHCCLYGRRPSDDPAAPPLPDDVFFVPEVLKQSAELWLAEVDAIGHNEDATAAHVAHVARRQLYKEQVRLEAEQLLANDDRIADEIEERLLALGFDSSDIDGWRSVDWCRACFSRDYADDLERWRHTYGTASVEVARSDGLQGVTDADMIVEREMGEEMDLKRMLAAWHVGCLPARGSLDQPSPYTAELLTEEEWVAGKTPLIEYAERRRQQRLRSEALGAFQDRQEALRPLYNRLRPVVTPRTQGVFVQFGQFVDLPSVKPLWRRGAVPEDAETWTRLEAVITSDILHRIHLDKVLLFDRIARSLLGDGYRIGGFAQFVLEREPSPFVDFDPSKGLAPYFAALSDGDMKPIFDRLAALFRCGVCSKKLSYPAIAVHIDTKHGPYGLLSSACPPSDSFRTALKRSLGDIGAPFDISAVDFKAQYGPQRFDTYLRTRDGGTRKSEFESWATVTAGSTVSEQRDLNDGFRRDSRDRDIVKIKPSRFPNVVRCSQATSVTTFGLVCNEDSMSPSSSLRNSLFASSALLLCSSRSLPPSTPLFAQAEAPRDRFSLLARGESPQQLLPPSLHRLSHSSRSLSRSQLDEMGGLTDKLGISSLTSFASSKFGKASSPSFSSVGIEGKEGGEVVEGAGASQPAGGRLREVGATAPSWLDDEDGNSLLGTILRILEVFLPFVNLIIFIAQASFQAKWNVGISGRVGLSLFVCIEALVHGGLVLSAFTLADRFHFLRGLERGLKQVRIAVILNAFQTGVMLILALVTSISANVGGCKDASKDPHHDLKGYTDALPGFCRDKRASAAFFWLNFVAWAITLGLCLLTFARIRRNPRTGGFVPPGSHFPQDDEEAWNRPSYEAGYGPSEGAGGEQGYRPSHEYSAQGERLFDEPRGYATTGIRDPFEDPGYDSSAGQGRYGRVDDPYEAIRNSMDVHRK
ncbi:hypothetical protein NBRC10512_004720 [Rhodotorula toruloides]|uniref:Uncharacterized protein n=1 Tax=Rhodotorula toruloides (strain NP11) TaxID=1130832 RepID=M7WR62_RHOT1|nr:uncharacterized protein RHTO_07918 [Rhodotorula toruloides NP11]EMS23047.1 hypothetical protein RHTO_07918 [Rhodotorula toruloides NP11]